MHFPPLCPTARKPDLLWESLKCFMVLFYGIPLGVGIWWLVLFTRPRVAAAFAAPTSLAAYPSAMDVTGFPLPEPAVAPSISPKAACPLPLMIFAGFLIFSSVCMVLFVLFPMTGAMPFFLFGHFFSGLSAKAIFGIMGLVFGVGAIGILKLKPWALDTVLVLQLVLLSKRSSVSSESSFSRSDARGDAARRRG